VSSWSARCHCLSVWFQKRWSSVVVMICPSTRRATTLSSCTQTARTFLAARSPVRGSVASTLSPGLTLEIGFLVPSAIKTAVWPEKLQALNAALPSLTPLPPGTSSSATSAAGPPTS
jgi:hypothetical protein